MRGRACYYTAQAIGCGKDFIMESKTPLLESLGYQRMIETISPDDIRPALKLLSQFLTDFADVDYRKVAVLAYLFGVRQGSHDHIDGIDSRFIEEKILRAHEMGRQQGLHHMAVLLGAEPMFAPFAPKFFFGRNLNENSNGENDKASDALKNE